jgi:hypothetical protein
LLTNSMSRQQVQVGRTWFDGNRTGCRLRLSASEGDEYV